MQGQNRQVTPSGAQASGTAIAHGAFAAISQRFPAIRMLKVDTDPGTIGITIPQQPGVVHPVWLGHDGRDGLQFSVGHFWLEWHPFMAPDLMLEWAPCTSPEVVAAYVDAVTGYLAGTCRVVEEFRGWQCVFSELQGRRNGEWIALSSWSRKGSLPAAASSRRELINTA